MESLRNRKIKYKKKMMIKRRRTENRKKRHNVWIKMNEISMGSICIICSYKMATVIFPIVQVSDLTQMQ